MTDTARIGWLEAFDARYLRMPSTLALIAANLVPVYGVLFWGWDLFGLMVLYWVETAIIGERVRIYQAVTLGAKRFPADEEGNLQKGQPRHPIVEDDVVIYAGATILGRITIGKGSTIGGNVWLTRSVPENSNITQANLQNESGV